MQVLLNIFQLEVFFTFWEEKTQPNNEKPNKHLGRIFHF